MIPGRVGIQGNEDDAGLDQLPGLLDILRRSCEFKVVDIDDEE